MHIIARHDPFGDLSPFHAAAFPVAVGAVPDVERDLVIIERAAASARTEPQLAIVMDEIASGLAVGRDGDADAMISAHLVVGDLPALAFRMIADRALLVGTGVVFDDQILDGDAVRLSAERKGTIAELDGVTGRVVREIDRVVVVVVEERAGLDLRFLRHGAERLAVEIEVLRIAAARIASAAFAMNLRVRIDRLVARDVERAVGVEMCQQIRAVQLRAIIADEDIGVA